MGIVKSLFEKGNNVVIQGDFIPITSEQYEVVKKAAKMIQDVGLQTAVTSFYIDSKKESGGVELNK